jgi:hypothetical protein
MYAEPKAGEYPEAVSLINRIKESSRSSWLSLRQVL